MLLYIIILFPLLGFFSCTSFLRKRLGALCYPIIIGISFTSFFLSFILFYDVVSTGNIYKLTPSIIDLWFLDKILPISVHHFMYDSYSCLGLLWINLMSFLFIYYLPQYLRKNDNLIILLSRISLLNFFFLLILAYINGLVVYFSGLCGLFILKYFEITSIYIYCSSNFIVYVSGLCGLFISTCFHFFLVEAYCYSIFTKQTLQTLILISFKYRYPIMFFIISTFSLTLIKHFFLFFTKKDNTKNPQF